MHLLTVKELHSKCERTSAMDNPQISDFDDASELRDESLSAVSFLKSTVLSIRFLTTTLGSDLLMMIERFQAWQAALVLSTKVQHSMGEASSSYGHLTANNDDAGGCYYLSPNSFP